MENKEDDKLFGFTQEQLYEAMKKFQTMDREEARNFLRSNPLAKIFMKDLSATNEKKKNE